MQAHVGVLSFKVVQELGDSVGDHHGNRPNLQHATLVVPGVVEGDHCLVPRRGNPARKGEKDASVLGELHLSRGPVEQLDSQLALERLDVLGKRGLRDKELVRCLQVVAGLGEHNKLVATFGIHGTLPVRQDYSHYGIKACA